MYTWKMWKYNLLIVLWYSNLKKCSLVASWSVTEGAVSFLFQ